MKKLPFGTWYPLLTKLYEEGHCGMIRQLNITLIHVNYPSLIALQIQEGTGYEKIIF